MKTSHKLLLLFVAIAVTFTAGRYSKPTKVETKEVVKTVTIREEAKTRVVYRDKVTKPDGTIIEKEVEKEDTKSTETAKSESNKESVVKNDIGLVLGILGTIDISDLNNREYSVIASKRVIGALNVVGGVGVSDKGKVKVSGGLGWSF